MIVDALKREIAVGNFVFHIGRFYVVTRVTDSKVYVNNLQGWKLVADKAIDPSKSLIVSEQDVSFMLLANA